VPDADDPDTLYNENNLCFIRVSTHHSTLRQPVEVIKKKKTKVQIFYRTYVNIYLKLFMYTITGRKKEDIFLISILN
jgi:hypothetical protein